MERKTHTQNNGYQIHTQGQSIKTNGWDTITVETNYCGSFKDQQAYFCGPFMDQQAYLQCRNTSLISLVLYTH